MLNPDEARWLQKAVSKGAALRLEELYGFFSEAMQRWRQFHGSLPLSWVWVRGGVTFCEGFTVPEAAAAILAGCEDTRRVMIATAYLSWRRGEKTRVLANPYEPLIDFLHHGGVWWRPENGVLDIYDSFGQGGGIPGTYPITESTIRARALAALKETPPLERGIRQVSMTAAGLIRCPYCSRSFDPRSSKSWDGERHLTCGTYLKFVPDA